MIVGARRYGTGHAHRNREVVKVESEQTQTRVVRFCLDSAALTSEQRVLLERHAGTARAVYNWGLALRNDQEDARRRWLQERSLTEAAGEEAAAALRADPTWVKQALTKAPDEIPIRLTGDRNRRIPGRTR